MEKTVSTLMDYPKDLSACQTRPIKSFRRADVEPAVSLEEVGIGISDSPTMCPVCLRPISRNDGIENEHAISATRSGLVNTGGQTSIPSKVSIDPEKVEQGLAKLVLAIVELIRQLLEKQAIRRVESGSLTNEEIERLGITLMRLETKMKELKEHFKIDDLNINLGPLGNLLD
jgi:hypothetical protein